jgi:hypothetical protein
MAGGLLDAIRGGAQLRKAAPAAPAPASAGRGGLLSEIKGRNFALKKVEERKAEEATKAPPIAVTGAAASIAAVLARRSAIQGDESDDGGDDDDDWD